ncbi:MAG: MAPEG family protein [Pseudolabrys sp.]
MERPVMTHEQRQVLAGMAAAVALTVIALLAAYFLSKSGADTLRLSAPEASALAALALVFCIGGIARKRFFHTDVIGGAAYDKPGSEVAVDKVVLQNTLEQTVLAAVGYNGLAAVLPGIAPALLPVLVSLFLIGRILFIAGYAKGAGGRAFGFALTFYPTVAAYAILVAALLARL